MSINERTFRFFFHFSTKVQSKLRNLLPYKCIFQKPFMSIPQKISSEKYLTVLLCKCASEITQANKFNANSVLIKTNYEIQLIMLKCY